MSKSVIDTLKSQVEKFDLTTPDGRTKAADVVRAALQKSNAEAHAKRKEAHAIAELLRSIEVDPDRRLKRLTDGRRGAGYALIPAAKKGKK